MPEQDQPLRVLVIEDEEEVARAVLRGLARAGLSAAWASRGDTGLAMKSSFNPHVVLVDPVLPDMNGRSLVALLGRTRDCGVVVLSGSPDDEGKAAKEFGADAFIAKPPNMREVVARIHAVHERVNLRGHQADTISG